MGNNQASMTDFVSTTTATSASKRVGLVYDPRMLLHSPRLNRNHVHLPAHPERPERVAVIMDSFQRHGYTSKCLTLAPRMATQDELERVHSRAYIQSLQDEWECSRMNPLCDDVIQCATSPDNYMNAFTFDCARLSAGCSLEACMRVLDGTVDRAFVCSRPPSHHAQSDNMAGFCFFNNEALCAFYAAQTHGQRVLVIDYDIHCHGDGKPTVFEDVPGVALFSIHKWDNGTFYPASPLCKSGRYGKTQNVLFHGYNGTKDDAYYMDVFRRELVPFARQFRPDLVIVAAGFDAMRGDANSDGSGSVLTADCYYEMTRLIRTEICPRMVNILEGGYSLDNLQQASRRVMDALLE